MGKPASPPYRWRRCAAWFQIGEFTNAAGTIFHGDINRFYAGDGTAGMFMSGFFPIMMFGLPGAALAMYFAAPKERRPMVGGMLLSVAITAFLTGVTEPLEFLFMFLAPLLYLLHAILTGVSLFIATLLGIHAGFSFSAGAIDYVLMYSLPAASNNVWMLLVMGLVFFVIYFLLFSAVIRMFNLKTPGREDSAENVVTEEANSNTEEGLTQLATSYIAAVGGTDNLKAIDACITRLRLSVADSARVSDAMCKRLGASGVVKLNKQTIQVIVGAKAESIGDAMKRVVARGPVAAASVDSAAPTAAPAAKPQAVPNASTIAALVSPVTGDVVALEQVPDEAFASKAVGDGIAVKPTEKTVVSPAAGTIVKIFNTNHAFCLETDKGAEIVVHMGIDTVALGGQGFTRLVEEGAEVVAGQPILEMDLDYLNANARSMISPVVCSNIDDFSGLVIQAQGQVVAGQTPLYEIKGK
jgi:PTS system N-acetylglucosamine-specific IIC component